ncbi:MAG: SPOR domain-containing protein [Alcanivorax sp.]|nr:SPOR domain-containing protein [Alcanivorax sp.]
MNEQTRRRLVGMTVLVISAVLLAPFVFRSPEQVRNALDMQIPASPQVAEVDVTPVIPEQQTHAVEQDIADDHQAVTDQAQASLDGQKKPATTPPSTPGNEDLPAKPGSSNDGPALAGYTVQVGSFSDQNNAQSLVDRLKAADYRAYLRPDSSGDKTLYRVFVGPEIRKSDADKSRQTLSADSRFSLQGLVRVYVP